MILFPDFQFFLFIPVYLLAIFLAFFIPGDLLVKKFFTNKTLFRTASAFTLGISLWAIQGLVFGYLQVRFLTYLYLIVSLVIWLKANSPKSFKVSFSFLKKFDPISSAIIILGGLLMISAVWLIGYQQGEQIIFCCRSVPDSIYHIALINNLVTNFPPTEPGSSDIVVKNYHYLSNLVLGDLVRVFKLPLIPTIYQYSSVLIVALLSLVLISFARIANLGLRYQRLLLFFFFFAGDLIYLLIFLRHQTVYLTFSYLDDVTKLLTSPSRSLSIVLFIGLLTPLVMWMKDHSGKLGIIIGLIAGSIIGFKVYTAVPVYIGLLFLTVYMFWKTKSWQSFIPLLVSALLAAAIYLPVNSGAGGLIFNGSWRLEDFIIRNDFSLQNIEFGRQYLFVSNNLFRVWLIQIFYFLLFCVFVLGTINLMFFQGRKSLARLPMGLNLFLIPGLLASLVLGIFTIQSIAPANTIQFLITLFSLGGIYAALTLDTYLPKLAGKKAVLVIIVIGVVTLFTATRSVSEGLGNIVSYKDREKFILTPAEIEAANYLKNSTSADSIILLDPEQSLKGNNMYLTFLADKKLFLAGTSDHGVAGLEDRIAFTQGEISEEQLKARGIDYVYLQNPAVNYPTLESVFSNEAGTIYKVNQD